MQKLYVGSLQLYYSVPWDVFIINGITVIIPQDAPEIEVRFIETKYYLRITQEKLFLNTDQADNFRKVFLFATCLTADLNSGTLNIEEHLRR